MDAGQPIPCYQRALPSRPGTAQGSLAADLVVIPAPPPRPDALRARSARANVPIHPHAGVPYAIPQPLPSFPSTVSGIQVNRPIIRLTVIPAKGCGPCHIVHPGSMSSTRGRRLPARSLIAGTRTSLPPRRTRRPDRRVRLSRARDYRLLSGHRCPIARCISGYSDKRLSSAYHIAAVDGITRPLDPLYDRPALLTGRSSS